MATCLPLPCQRDRTSPKPWFNVAQTNDDILRRLGFKFARAKGSHGLSACHGYFHAPAFDAAFAQQVFQKLPFFRRQILELSL